MKVDICFTPALYPYYSDDDSDKIVVVVDIFRATTTMCAALNNRARAIIPVASIEEAQAYKSKGYLVGAERNVRRCDFADFGNSPFDYTEDKVGDKEVVFTTTNGTQAIEMASAAGTLIIGAFSNIDAVADFCVGMQKDVIVLCAGWNNRFNIEDSLFGGALARRLIGRGYASASDATQVALSMWEEAKPDVRNYINRTEHVKRLEANNLQDSVEYCLTEDTVDLVPVYNRETRKIIIA
ncbi:2-phosphosulfolactate phosphatase [Dysgonomonas sp. PFB1-18]|uniref:2-phosphosulfolactate phosphatase n=1 Tax=unclassified Dysgonomonas TaxID=2630389 RepID=UPI00247595C0|nr:MULTISPECIES: 2-phosphosulfolactate phosphatase [unclassified Dysgonomonas]MDH6308615.1 2-phosphosulfolactate phosphatase [Dysgonomonas sp. PF1-14]MDH6338116.1 2-phosphosulfolactate phosphatase [Dysgonomonas sp. PF1-16]MDH6379613.1 2-phosphosulfolactate phosphatase [Dysgonomonas sp. PFB1-18]MDH6396943.1 2-phosphosulfolactate phosphatase [Dysgonomonas sp. PF1-23]